MVPENETITINIANEFSDTPGSRYEKDGPDSGQRFRKEFLEPHFENRSYNYKVRVVFDGAEGYATSFLEEAFGGLARIYGKERCLARLEFISEEDRLLIEETIGYIEASDER